MKPQSQSHTFIDISSTLLWQPETFTPHNTWVISSSVPIENLLLTSVSTSFSFSDLSPPVPHVTSPKLQVVFVVTALYVQVIQIIFSGSLLLHYKLHLNRMTKNHNQLCSSLGFRVWWIWTALRYFFHSSEHGVRVGVVWLALLAMNIHEVGGASGREFGYETRVSNGLSTS